MKIKYVWEEKDIEAGLYIIRESSPLGTTNLSFAMSVTFKIGFDMSNRENKYNRISCLTDGMVSPIADTRAGVATYLNNDPWGYRPLTKEEFINLINNTEKGFIKVD